MNGELGVESWLRSENRMLQATFASGIVAFVESYVSAAASVS